MSVLHKQIAFRKLYAISQKIKSNKYAYLPLRLSSSTIHHGKYISQYDTKKFRILYMHDNIVPLYTSWSNLYGMRQFHVTSCLCEHTPSSKIEATVQSMKDKQKEKVEEIMKEAIAKDAKGDSGKIGLTKTTTASKSTEPAKPTAVVKKPLKTRIWEEVLHYYHGFRLLFIDINVCRKLVWRVLNGKTLTRRESKLLVRTTSDLFRLIPFSVFIIVPFMELLLPVFIKFFPGMLPSTFQTPKEREDKLKQSLQMKLEMAKFLQKTLDEMSVEHKEHKSEEAKNFVEFFKAIKDPTQYVSSEDIIKFAKRFEDEVTLDSLSVDQLSALCRLLELNTMGTSNLLRFQLRVKLRSLAADDRVIAREGVNSLDLFELQQACKARGMRAYGLTAARLREQLQEWIDLSLNEKVPPTLLLLSRAMLVSDETTTTDKLKETIRVLPDSVAAQTKAAIGEREGKIDNKTKIEVIKEEERRIKEEREEERQERAAKLAETLVDKAPIIQDTATQFSDAPLQSSAISNKADKEKVLPTPDERISSKDVNLLSEALKSLSPDKKMVVEKETIKELKEELAEYKEDVEELHEVRNVVKEQVNESRAAKMLFNKVNEMINKLDKVVHDLEKRNQALDGHVNHACDPTDPNCTKYEDMVKVEEVISIIKKLQQTSNASRLQQIQNILSKIDADKDGVITVEEVLKVVEALGRENIHLSEKQIEEVVTLLDKEQLIEAEEKIEKAIAKSIKEAESIKAKKEAQKKYEAETLAAAQLQSKENEIASNETKIAEGGAKDELKDIAPEIKDKAVNLSLDDKKHLLMDKETITKANDITTIASSVNNSSVLSQNNSFIVREGKEPKDNKALPVTNATFQTTIPTSISSTHNNQINSKDKML